MVKKKMKSKFIDLHYECNQLKSSILSDRIKELAKNLPTVSITAIGGLPISNHAEFSYWCGFPINEKRFFELIKNALGNSAVLTYTNKNKKSLIELGNICIDKNHLWGAHWINITMTLARFPLAVQMAFACDKRFYLSWPIEEIPTGQVFSATAGLKEWLEYLNHKDDGSFDKHTRYAMTKATEVLKWDLK